MFKSISIVFIALFLSIINMCWTSLAFADATASVAVDAITLTSTLVENTVDEASRGFNH